MNTYLWELTLEAARFALDPSLPSRLESTFAWESIDDARWYKAKFKKDASIYVVEPISDTLPFYRGSFSLITPEGKASGEPYISYMPPAARQYWTDEPKGRIEIIYQGRLRIVGKA